MEELEREEMEEKPISQNIGEMEEDADGRDKMNESKFGELRIGESVLLGKAPLQSKQRPRLMSFEEAVAGETMARCLADLTHRNRHHAIVTRGRLLPQQFGRSQSYTSNVSGLNGHPQHRGRANTPAYGAGRRMLSLTPKLERSSNSQEFVQEKSILRQISEPAMLSCFVDDNGLQNLNRSRSNNTGFTSEGRSTPVGGSCNTINHQRHSSPHPSRRLGQSRCMSYSEQVNSLNDNIKDTNALNHAQSEPKLRDSPTRRLIVVDIPLESEAELGSSRAVQGNNFNMTEMNGTTTDGRTLNDNRSESALITATDLKVRRGKSGDDNSTHKPQIEDIWTRREDFVPPNSAIPKVLDTQTIKCNSERAKMQATQQGVLSQGDRLDNAPPGGGMDSSRDNLICTAESGMNGMYHDEEEGGEIGVYEAMEHTTDSETCDSSSVDSRNEVMSIERGSYTVRGSNNMECRSAPLLRKQVSFDLSLTFFDDDIVNGRAGRTQDSVGKSSPWFKRLRRPTRSRSDGRIDGGSLDDVFEEPEPKSGTLPRNIGSTLFNEDTEIDNSRVKFNSGKPKSSTLPASYRALPQNKTSIMQPDFFIRKNEKYPKPRKKDLGKVKIPKQRSHSDNNPYSCDKREKRSSIIMEEEDIVDMAVPTNKRPFSGLRRMLSRESIQNKQGKALRRRSKSESCMMLPLGNCKVCEMKVERGDEVAMPTEDIIHKRCFKCDRLVLDLYTTW